LVAGFEVSGTVRNLTDGRVELLAEGTREELQALLTAVRDSGLGPLIRSEDASWSQATGAFRGFSIAS
jgi:acylphosphatase